MQYGFKNLCTGMEVDNTLNFNRNQDSVNSKVLINEKTSVPDPFTVHHSSKIKSLKEVIKQ